MTIEDEYKLLGAKVCEGVHDFKIEHIEEEGGNDMTVLRCRKCELAHFKSLLGVSGWMMPDGTKRSNPSPRLNS